MVNRADSLVNEGKVNIAIVGLGAVSKFQLSALRNIPSFKLTAVCDRDPSKNVAPEVPFYESVEDMLDSSNDIDVVLVSVPTHAHYSVGKVVLEKGKHLLIEKPAAETVSQFNDLIKISMENKRMLEFALHFRYSEDVIWLRSHLEGLKSGYGAINGFYTSFNDPYFSSGKLFPEAASLSGSWLDSGINALSCLADLISDIKFQDGTTTRFQGVDVQSNAFFTFKLEGNERGYGSINTNWTNGSRAKSTKLFFSDGLTEIELDHTDHSVKLHRNGETKVMFESPRNENRLTQHYIHVFNEFLKDYRQQKTNLEFSRLVHLLLFSAMRSEDGGRISNGAKI